MKTENENKRTKRKEIQFSEAEYAVVEKKANAALGFLWQRSSAKLH